MNVTLSFNNNAIINLYVSLPVTLKFQISTWIALKTPASFQICMAFLLTSPCLEPFSKKWDISGTKNEKKIESLWFSFFFKNIVLETTDIQVLKNSTLHHKIPMLGSECLLQRLSVNISSNIRHTITQSYCW